MNKRSIHQINSLLTDEISAIETYSEALKRTRSERVRGILSLCQMQHQERAQMLKDCILKLGGKPNYSAHPWGAIVKLIAASVLALDERSAIAIFEEGEDVGLISYREAMKKLDQESARVVEIELLPAQNRTCQAIHDLREHLARAN